MNVNEYTAQNLVQIMKSSHFRRCSDRVKPVKDSERYTIHLRQRPVLLHVFCPQIGDLLVEMAHQHVSIGDALPSRENVSASPHYRCGVHTGKNRGIRGPSRGSTSMALCGRPPSARRGDRGLGDESFSFSARTNLGDNNVGECLIRFAIDK